MSAMKEVLIEAAKRLELMGFDFEDDVVQKVLAGEEPMCSDNTRFHVRNITDEEKERIKTFTEEYKHFVYHVIRSDFGEIGILESYFYICIPLDDEECDYERYDIREGYPTAYVNNLTYPELSEFGSIAVEFKHNAIIRTD